MGRGHPTSRTPSDVTGLEVLLKAKNDKIAKLEAQLAFHNWLLNYEWEFMALSKATYEEELQEKE